MSCVQSQRIAKALPHDSLFVRQNTAAAQLPQTRFIKRQTCRIQCIIGARGGAGVPSGYGFGFGIDIAQCRSAFITLHSPTRFTPIMFAHGDVKRIFDPPAPIIPAKRARLQFLFHHFTFLNNRCKQARCKP